jgi:hypothetical protein
MNVHATDAKFFGDLRQIEPIADARRLEVPPEAIIVAGFGRNLT